MRKWQPDEDGVLYEGVPAHLGNDLRAWVRNRIGRTEVCRAIGRNLRLDLSEDYPHHEIVQLSFDDPEKFLDVIAFLLSLGARDVDDLSTVLEQGGSAWRAASDPGGGWGLERRVDPTVQDQYEQAAEPSDTASAHLREAWHAAFGIHPDGQKAYDQAVMAVECALKPVVAPSDGGFTLGKGIKNMGNGGATNFEFDPAHRRATPDIGHFVGMCKQLQNGQARHGEADAVAANSLAEGIAATHLAVAIVSLVRCGAFRRVT